jgi:hypothetical protein
MLLYVEIHDRFIGRARLVFVLFCASSSFIGAISSVMFVVGDSNVLFRGKVSVEIRSSRAGRLSFFKIRYQEAVCQ